MIPTLAGIVSYIIFKSSSCNFVNCVNEWSGFRSDFNVYNHCRCIISLNFIESSPRQFLKVFELPLENVSPYKPLVVDKDIESKRLLY